MPSSARLAMTGKSACAATRPALTVQTGPNAHCRSQKRLWLPKRWSRVPMIDILPMLFYCGAAVFATFVMTLAVMLPLRWWLQRRPGLPEQPLSEEQDSAVWPPTPKRPPNPFNAGHVVNPMNHPDDTESAAPDLQNEWIECPHCRSVMLPLREYEIQRSSEFPAVEAELWEFLLWGWMAFVSNFVCALIGFGGRKATLAKQKQDILPRFPNSLVCPRCFVVIRRV